MPDVLIGGCCCTFVPFLFTTFFAFFCCWMFNFHDDSAFLFLFLLISSYSSVRFSGQLFLISILVMMLSIAACICIDLSMDSHLICYLTLPLVICFDFFNAANLFFSCILRSSLLLSFIQSSSFSFCNLRIMSIWVRFAPVGGDLANIEFLLNGSSNPPPQNP